MRGNLTKVDLVSLVLRELPWSRQHRFDGTTGQSIFPLDDELVAIAGDELDKPAGDKVLV